MNYQIWILMQNYHLLKFFVDFNFLIKKIFFKLTGKTKRNGKIHRKLFAANSHIRSKI
jgi:hypothetical protein